MKIYSFEAPKRLSCLKRFFFSHADFNCGSGKESGRLCWQSEVFYASKAEANCYTVEQSLGMVGSCIFDDSLARPLTLCDQQDQTFQVWKLPIQNNRTWFTLLSLFLTNFPCMMG